LAICDRLVVATDAREIATVVQDAGFEAVMTGARERLEDDGALLAEMSSVLDSLHAHFQRAAAPSKP